MLINISFVIKKIVITLKSVNWELIKRPHNATLQ